MADFQKSPDRVIVSFAEKAVQFRTDGLPGDWEALLRDPEVVQCVDELVLERGASRDQGPPPVVDWKEVTARLQKLEGTTG